MQEMSQNLLSLHCNGPIDRRKKLVTVATSDVERPVTSSLQDGTVLHHHGHTDPAVTKLGAIAADGKCRFLSSLTSHVALVRMTSDVKTAIERLRCLQASSDHFF
jgi:hypothetical protein